LGDVSLYFFPDRILVYTLNAVGAIGYDDLHLEIDCRRFIEDESVPRDAEIVDHTWRYVNKGGGPDRRFRANPELPVCLYEEIRLRSSSGLNELLQVSHTGIGVELQRSVASVASALAAAKMAQETREQEGRSVRRGQDSQGIPQAASEALYARQDPTADAIYETLFSVLCCVMVADGRASRSEKAAVRERMLKARAPWPAELIEQRIAQFIQRIQTAGYSAVVSDMLSQVSFFKHIGRADVLLRCIDSLTAADGTLNPGEKTLCDRIRKELN
jgi:uncharacterized tellurite resistance protein B-like protein